MEKVQERRTWVFPSDVEELVQCEAPRHEVRFHDRRAYIRTARAPQ